MITSKNSNSQATEGRPKGRFVKIFIGGMIAIAILFTVVNKIGLLPCQKETITNNTDSEESDDSFKEQLTGNEVWFYEKAEEIAQLDVQSRTEADIDLHSSLNWEEPAEGNHWIANMNYRISLPLPISFMDYGHKIAINVSYPDMVAACETGIITITAKDENGVVCTGEYLVTPLADLYLAHGKYSDFHGEIIGDAIDINDYLNAIIIDFSTFANKYNGKHPDNLSARTGACPTTVVMFNSPLNLDSDL